MGKLVQILGKIEPFKPDFISPDYVTWAVKIKEFMTKARGGGTKETQLCRFVRLYIEQFDKSKTPHAFLIQEKFDIKPFRDLLENIESEPMRRKLVVYVNEFLDYIIDNDLTIEDDETGEIVRVDNARNPFSFYSTNRIYHLAQSVMKRQNHAYNIILSKSSGMDYSIKCKMLPRFRASS